jgi:hypothetical protein
MRITVLLFIVFFSVKTMAQPAKAMIDYDKLKVPGYTMELPYAPGVAEDAIRDRFKSKGIIGKEHKGFWEFRNVLLPEIRKEMIDVYVNIDRKSRKEKDVSILSVILTEPGIAPGASDSVVNAARGNNGVMEATGAFVLLSSLNDNTADLSLELYIKKQEEEVQKAEKANKNLMSDEEDLQKKLKKTQEDISDNKNKQVKQAEELARQKELLMQLQSRRRKIPAVAN